MQPEVKRGWAMGSVDGCGKRRSTTVRQDKHLKDEKTITTLTVTSILKVFTGSITLNKCLNL